MALYLGAMGADERRAAEFRLRQLADSMGVDHLTCPWHGPGLAEHVRRAIPAEDRRLATPVREALQLVRGMMREACRNGALPWDAMEAGGLSNLAANRRVASNPRGGRLLAVRRCLTEGELTALLGACAWDRSTAGVRDLALICVVYAGGLTGFEVAALRCEDWCPERPSLSTADGRVVLLGHAAAEAVAAWDVVRNRGPERMFYGVDPSGNVRASVLNRASLSHILKLRSRQAATSNACPRQTFAVPRCTPFYAPGWTMTP